MPQRKHASKSNVKRSRTHKKRRSTAAKKSRTGQAKAQKGAGCGPMGDPIGKYLNSSCNAGNVHGTHPEADLSLVNGAGLLPGVTQLGGNDGGNQRPPIGPPKSTYDDPQNVLKQLQPAPPPPPPDENNEAEDEDDDEDELPPLPSHKPIKNEPIHAALSDVAPISNESIYGTSRRPASGTEIRDTGELAHYNIYTTPKQRGRGYGAPQKGAGCPTSQASPMTFKDYLDIMSVQLGGADTPDPLTNTSSAPQRGGTGYSVNPENMIGGLPTYDKYDRNAPPALIGGKLLQSATGQSLCGSQVGAGKSKKSSSSSKVNRARKALRKTKRSNGKGKKAKRTQKKRRTKAKRSKMTKSKRQRGGLAPLSTAHDGEPSDFDYLPEGKDFAASQPNWSPQAR